MVRNRIGGRPSVYVDGYTLELCPGRYTGCPAVNELHRVQNHLCHAGWYNRRRFSSTRQILVLHELTNGCYALDYA